MAGCVAQMVGCSVVSTFHGGTSTGRATGAAAHIPAGAASAGQGSSACNHACSFAQPSAGATTFYDSCASACCGGRVEGYSYGSYGFKDGANSGIWGTSSGGDGSPVTFRPHYEHVPFDRPAAPTAMPVPARAAELNSALQQYDHERFRWSEQLSNLLHMIFGHKQFRQNQLAICNAAIAGSDVFVIMPTGGGKSLCYQLPAVLCGGVTVVICPLVSLIQDQVTQGNAMGIMTESLTSQQEHDAQAHVLSSLFRPHLVRSETGTRLLYVTPERLNASPGLQNALRALDSHGLLTRFVIDEAHCVSQARPHTE